MYEVDKGFRYAKGKFSPRITMGSKFVIRTSNMSPESLPGPGAYNNYNRTSETSKSFTMGIKLASRIMRQGEE